ncbi:MAG TPA: putative toxin-antitoxin system toxin component, PIN family [Spirochaetota bacterium]|nr:putative toxin-antitoxin system toxin component, PIN family [Spirochaetota bacterium]HOS34172.1 putative toxin-antitoxin system toxin component, PIN family [Spirochaetota bacterium]HOS56999.1 putative toxin-antitoxin system toxin component, PIN family [Spirochaetota bacterium]HQH31885.1 putative toxin-antitoxin system toxin component, PIN family [Spirochaetota bacterium]HQJ07248.1 putative toxin-antitoxin system toxin component, PIN family [Spirochaetota bacterium]
MKIILDTNVIISAFVFKGNCGKVFDLSVNFFDSYISQWILDEVSRVLKDKFESEESLIDEIKSILIKNYNYINPDNKLPEICRDIDDNNILQLAEYINADYLITGDKDLLILEKYYNTIILSPKDFVKIFDITD